MNIFEELMSKHQTFSDESLAESVRKKSMKIEAKKIDYRKIKVESLRIFENASDEDIEEIDKQFDTEVKDDEETDEDEVVLIIDPELPSDEEVPEDAAQDLVGDYVYKCPVCGANYVCNCDADMNESVEVDEEGVPVECPVCGDDSDQILIGQIAPADEVKDEDEGEMEPVDVDDAEDNEETEEEFSEDEIVEDSLKRRPLRRSMRTESKKKVCESTARTFQDLKFPKGNKEFHVVYRFYNGKEDSAFVTTKDQKSLEDTLNNCEYLEYWDLLESVKDESVKKSSKCPECGKDPCECDKKDEGCEKKSRKKKVKEWVDRDNLKRQVKEKTQKYLEYDSEALEDLVAKNGQDIGNLEIDEIAEIVAEEVLDEIYGDSYYGADSYETAYETVLDLMKDFSSQFESVKAKKSLRKKVKEDIEDDEEVDVNLDLDAPAPEIPPVEKEAPKVEVNADKVEIVLDDVRFNKLMNKMIRENYKGSPQFKLTKITSKDQKLTLEYNVAKVKGKFVAEGFSRNARVMKLRMRDQGAFTESFTKVPSFVVECVRIRNKIVPTKVSYNFTKKVNESLYRVKGEVNSKNSK